MNTPASAVVPSREAVETLQATFAGHAPGYWVADPDLREGMEWNVHILAGSDLLRSNIRICFMANSGGKNPAQDEANANLLAAAPQLAEWVGTLLAEVERLNAELKAALMQMDANAEFGVQASKECDSIRTTVAQLERTVADQAAVLAVKQAHIDALMLEYCPDDMTPEQLEEWGRNQQPIPKERQEAIDAALAASVSTQEKPK